MRETGSVKEKEMTGKEMITFEEAFSTVMRAAVELDMEEVALMEASGRVLYEDAVSDVDMPPFDKSAMDGFACREADLDLQLSVVETIPAGKMPERAIGSGECARIMTGAAVPPGADIVVKVEDTECSGEKVTITRKSGKKNICMKAEDISKGSTILKRGMIIGPARAGVLAAAGSGRVKVFRRPRVGIIATGSELVEPDELPEEAQIRNSNSYQLHAQSLRAGLDPVYLGIAGDLPGAIMEAVENGAGQTDVLLISGGVSMGDYDFVPSVLGEAGFDLLFEKVAIKPGKPTVFARRGDSFVFGLPGNPVSTFVLFEILVKPFCYRMMGVDTAGMKVRARLAGPVGKKGGKRLSHIPVKLEVDGTARPLEYHGSAHIHAYSEANGILAVPPGNNGIDEGEVVDVLIIDLPW